MSRTVFVFGSNLAGRHGKGSALEARMQYGAKPGVGSGPTGSAYAIPTKDAHLCVLPLERIAGYISHFIEYAALNPHVRFRIVDIGCGLAGYEPEAIAPFFDAAPENCEFIGKLRHILRRA